MLLCIFKAISTREKTAHLIENVYKIVIRRANRVYCCFYDHSDKICGCFGWIRHKSRWKGSNRLKLSFLTSKLGWACRNSCSVLTSVRPIVVQPHQDPTTWTRHSFLPKLYNRHLLNHWVTPRETATVEFGPILKIRRRKGFCFLFCLRFFVNYFSFCLISFGAFDGAKFRV